MHGKLLPELAQQMRDRATNVAWTQWAALGSGAVADRAAESVVDPESLILASMGLVDHERQLVDLLSWWAGAAAPLLSVQRIRNLSGAYPATVRERLREFAAYARTVGGDARWKSLAGDAAVAKGAGSGREPRLEGGATVMLRLRLGLGVGIKADMVAALLGDDESWWTVRELADGLGYTARAVRRAGLELVRGGWIESSPASPTEFRATARPWLPLLGLAAPVTWRHWHPLYAYVLSVDDWLRRGEWRGQELAEAERSARELVDGHRSVFKWSGVTVPEPVSRPGAEYIRGFAVATLRVVRYMEESV